MKIIHCKHFPPKGYKAITLGPVIIVRKPYRLNKVDINHETIHWEQYKEMLIIFFWIWYIIEFLIKLLKYQNWHKAYRAISFEREAYSNENRKYYISTRKHFSWIRYI